MLESSVRTSYYWFTNVWTVTIKEHWFHFRYQNILFTSTYSKGRLLHNNRKKWRLTVIREIMLRWWSKILFIILSLKHPLNLISLISFDIWKNICYWHATSLQYIRIDFFFSHHFTNANLYLAIVTKMGQNGRLFYKVCFNFYFLFSHFSFFEVYNLVTFFILNTLRILGFWFWYALIYWHKVYMCVYSNKNLTKRCSKKKIMANEL